MEDACMKLMEHMMDSLETAQGYAMVATKYKMMGDAALTTCNIFEFCEK